MSRLYQHKTRGFRLHEDAYERRCQQGEFARDEFELYAPAVEPAAEPALSPETPDVDATPVADAAAPESLTGPPIATTDEEKRFFTRPAPRKHR